MPPALSSPALPMNSTDTLTQKSISELGVAKNKAMTPQKAEKVAKDFESLFISQMVQQMFGKSSGSNAFGTSETDEIYKSLMVQEYGKIISQSGGIGIAENIKRELLKQQEQ